MAWQRSLRYQGRETSAIPGVDPGARVDRFLNDVAGSVGSQTLDIEDDLVRSALRVFADHGLDPLIWPHRGLSGPEAHFNRILGRSVVGSTGLGYASGHAAPNEFLVIEGDGRLGGLVELEQSFADLICAYADS